MNSPLMNQKQPAEGEIAFNMQDLIDWIQTDHMAEVKIAGKMLTWKIPAKPRKPRFNCPRSCCGMFSAKSRFNMLVFINQIDWSKPMYNLVITLTYPDCIDELSYRQMGAHRSRFHRYLEEFAGKHLAALWRIEWKARKSGPRKGQVLPHIHILLFGCRFIGYTHINEWWRKTIGVNTYVRTEIRGITKESQVGYYVAKYAGKVEDDSLVLAAYHNSGVGRSWGILRKELLPMCTEKTYTVDHKSASQMIADEFDEIRKFQSQFGNGSFSAMGPTALLIVKFLRDMNLDENTSSN